MEITDLKIRKMMTDGRLRAIVSITLDQMLAVHDIKVVQGETRLFVAMPSRKDEGGIFRDIVHPISAQARQYLENQILDAYQEQLALMQTYLFFVFRQAFQNAVDIVGNRLVEFNVLYRYFGKSPYLLTVRQFVSKLLKRFRALLQNCRQTADLTAIVRQILCLFFPQSDLRESLRPASHRRQHPAPDSRRRLISRPKTYKANINVESVTADAAHISAYVRTAKPTAPTVRKKQEHQTKV